MVRTCAVLLPLLLAMPAALAAESPSVRTAHAVASLVSDTDAVAPGTPFRLGLRLRLRPGWHTYWQNPGEAGVPPAIEWTLPPGATAGPIAWPTPERLREGPLTAFGYTGAVLLPVTVTPGTVTAGPGGATEVTATATWLACERVCVPEEGTFHLVLPAGVPAPSAEAPLFAAADAASPRPSPFAASVAPDGTLTLAGPGLSPAAVRDAWFFPAAPDAIAPSAPQTLRVEEGAVHLVLPRAAGFDAAVPLAGVAVLRDGGGTDTALLVSAAPGPASVARASVPAAVPFWQAALLALAGGLLLNLMPCVFPVLAMKAMALARLSGGERRAVRAHAVSYTAGVLLAFCGLGGVLLAARGAGSAVGWGFQFQSPAFVAVTAWVLFLVGLNLSGVFAVQGRIAGMGQGLAGRGGHAGSVMTGALAVLVATPCTAPFMGAAIAAALAAPPLHGVGVFAVMGAGLALPYAVLALAPSLARGLPRPGAWMDVARGVLAFPMYGATAWLVWVVSVEAGPAGVLAAGAGLVLLGFAAWLLGLAQASRRRPGYVAASVPAVVAAVVALVLLPGLAPAAGGAAPLPEGAEAFTPARFDDLRREGRPVFVNMTAAWCITCLVNERVALSSDRVQRAFAARGVTYLKGDWTRGDPAITAFLREHGRDGVPLYLLYPRGPGRPTVLPQILTEGEILERLEAASR